MLKPIIPTSDEVTLGPNTSVRLVLVFAFAGALMWAGWLTSEINTLKNAMTKLNNIEALQAQMSNLSMRMENLEKHGSEPVQALTRSVDKLATQMEAHIVATEKAKP